MPIQSDLPQIAALKLRVEEIYGIRPATHSDFLDMVAAIENALREHVSESTLERLWGYSTRENKEGTVSLRTLNVLARFCGYSGWEDFCQWLKKDQRKESELFEGQAVKSVSLEIGARLRIGWQPDRICLLQYLGNYVFEVESVENTSLEKGDRFKVVQFQKGRPLYLEEFIPASSSQNGCEPAGPSQKCSILGSEAGSSSGKSYAIGQEHGLTTLQLL